MTNNNESNIKSRNMKAIIMTQAIEQAIKLEKEETEISDMFNKIEENGLHIDLNQEEVINSINFESEAGDPRDIINNEIQAQKSTLYAGIDKNNVVINIIETPTHAKTEKQCQDWINEHKENFSEKNERWIKARPLPDKAVEPMSGYKYSDSMKYFYYPENPSVSRNWYFDFQSGEWIMPHILTEEEKQELLTVDQMEKIKHLEKGNKTWPPK